MDLEQIRLFVAVYRANSFVEVARELEVAPSSISRAIGNLEKALGVRLFQRTTRVLKPTQAGDAYHQRIAPLLEALDQTHAELRDASLTPSGLLRVTASVSYGEIVLAPRLRAFRQQHPQIELELILSDGRIDLLSERIDLAIRHGQLKDSTLIARKLADVHYLLVAAPEYLSNRSTPTSPGDLKDHEIVAFSYEDYREAWRFRRKKRAQTVSIQPVIRMTNAAAIRETVRHGLGIALLADWTVSGDIASGRLVRLMAEWEIQGKSSSSALWAVYPSRQYIPAKTRAFLDFLEDRKTA